MESSYQRESLRPLFNALLDCKLYGYSVLISSHCHVVVCRNKRTQEIKAGSHIKYAVTF